MVMICTGSTSYITQAFQQVQVLSKNSLEKLQDKSIFKERPNWCKAADNSCAEERTGLRKKYQMWNKTKIVSWQHSGIPSKTIFKPRPFFFFNQKVIIALFFKNKKQSIININTRKYSKMLKSLQGCKQAKWRLIVSCKRPSMLT